MERGDRTCMVGYSMAHMTDFVLSNSKTRLGNTAKRGKIRKLQAAQKRRG